MNYLAINTKTAMAVVTDQTGFDGLIASHTSQMTGVLAALESNIIRSSVEDGGWDCPSRGLRIEKTDLPVNMVPFQNTLSIKTEVVGKNHTFSEVQG